MSTPAFDPDATQALPAIDVAGPAAPVPPLVAPAVAPRPAVSDNRGLKAAVGVVLTRPDTSAATTASGDRVPPTTSHLADLTGALGGLAAAGTSTTTAAPTTTTPVTQPTTPTVPPSTQPPTTQPPTTQPPVTVPPVVTTPPAPQPPVITLAAPAKVNCTTGGTPYITLSWNAPGATSVDLAIDGPGLYKDYGGSAGSDSVPFACDGPHTYQLTAHSPAGPSTKTVVIDSYKITIPPGLGPIVLNPIPQI